MSSQDRLAPAIYLTSPSGQQFEALWRGDQRTMEKKLGIFEYPKARGAEVQDLEVGAVEYPLALHFEGPDHDLQARAFFEACKESGRWKVVHPVYGYLVLQLMTITEDAQPVSSGNVTEVQTKWIEPGIDLPAVSIAQLSAEIVSRINAVQIAAADELADTLDVKAPSALAQLKASVQRVLTIIATVKAGAGSVINTVTAIRNTVMGAISFGVSQITSLAGLLSTLVSMPGALLKDTGARFAFFEKVLSDSAASLVPQSADSAGRNTAAIRAHVATTALTGMAQAMVDAEFATREEAVSYLRRMQTAFIDVVNGLDAVQDLCCASTIDTQYFTLGNTYGDLAVLVQLTTDLLLRKAFDISASKRIVLSVPRAPIEVAITEGMDFDIFVAVNRLGGDEILLLPAGREVVVYL